MYKRIAVPLDGSQLAERATPVATDLAERLSASLVLIGVLDRAEAMSPDALRVLEGAGVWTGVPRPPEASPEERLNAYLSKIAGQVPVSAPVRTVVRQGDAATEIVAAAGEEKVALIVMTTRGRTGVTRGLLGSVADRVVHASELPVLLVRSDVSPGTDTPLAPFKHVIVPLDGSTRAEASLAHAEVLAKAYEARIVALRIIEPPTLAYASAPYVWPGSYVDEVDRALTADAQRYLDSVAKKLKSGGRDVETLVEHGTARARINEIAEARQDSVIVMTTRGHTGLTRWVLGSVADGLVHTASVPVMVVRTEDLA